jgi:hypothetical protein
MYRMKKVLGAILLLSSIFMFSAGAMAEVNVYSQSGEVFTVDVNAVNISHIEYNPGMLIYTLTGVVHPVSVVAADVVRIEFVTTTSGTQYNIVARHSGKCLDINGASTEDGALLLQWDCIGVSNQVFILVPAGGDFYQIVAAHSNKCLDVDTSEDTYHNGAEVRQMTCSGADNQQFRLEDAGDGYFKIKAKHSELVLDVYGKSEDNGAKVVQWTDSSSTNQAFELRQVE